MLKKLLIAFIVLVSLNLTATVSLANNNIPWQELNPATKLNPNNSRTLIARILGGDGTAQGPGLLVLAIVFGGFGLLVMLVMGGFTMLTNPTNPQAQEAGKSRITYAIAGFVLLFTSFWIAQILEIIFGINIV